MQIYVACVFFFLVTFSILSQYKKEKVTEEIQDTTKIYSRFEVKYAFPRRAWEREKT